MIDKNQDDLVKLRAAECTAQRTYIEALSGCDPEATRQAADVWAAAARQVSEALLMQRRAAKSNRQS